MEKNILDMVEEGIESVFRLLSFREKWNDHKFEEFFEGSGLKNSKGKYPRLTGWVDEGIYNVYKFKISPGLSERDFNSKVDALALFMKVPSNTLEFKISDDFYSNKFYMELYEIRLSKLFEKIKIRNKERKYPVLDKYEEIGNEIIYTFKVPEGIYLQNFKDKEKKLRKLIGTDKTEFKQSANRLDIDLIISKR